MRPTRRAFLAGTAALGAAAGLTLPFASARSAGAKRLVLVQASGGWDVTYALDPKIGLSSIDGPDLDEDPNNADDREAIETINGIPLMSNRVKRPAVSSFFERWGAQAAVLNGVWVGSVAHPACSVRMLTGARTEAQPDIAAVTGAVGGEAAPIPYMDLSGLGFTGDLAAFSGRTGARNQLKVLLDRSTPLAGPAGTSFRYPGFTPTSSDQADLQAFLDQRAASFAAATAGLGQADRRIADLLEARERAQALTGSGGDFADSLQIGRQSSLATMAPTVRQLLSSGLCHTVSIDAGPSFDTHDDNSDQHAAWEATFSGLHGLMAELDAGGLLSDTVVVVVSEMTRTPKRNGAGGKDHWPITSAMVLGAGVRGGQVYGGSTDLLDGRPVDLATGQISAGGQIPRYDNLAAGILTLCDIDPEEWLPGVEAYRAFHA